jgi:hypothetical protein
LFKIAIQGVSLWHFHVYVHCNPNLFISFIFLLSSLVSFLWWLQQVQKFCIYSCIEKTSTTFTCLTSFFYPPPLTFISRDCSRCPSSLERKRRFQELKDLSMST